VGVDGIARHRAPGGKLVVTTCTCGKGTRR
jgi:hypothetical protein